MRGYVQSLQRVVTRRTVEHKRDNTPPSTHCLRWKIDTITFEDQAWVRDMSEV